MNVKVTVSLYDFVHNVFKISLISLARKCFEKSVLYFEAGFNQGLRHEEATPEVHSAMQEECGELPQTIEPDSSLLLYGANGGAPSGPFTINTNRCGNVNFTC